MGVGGLKGLHFFNKKALETFFRNVFTSLPCIVKSLISDDFWRSPEPVVHGSIKSSRARTGSQRPCKWLTLPMIYFRRSIKNAELQSRGELSKVIFKNAVSEFLQSSQNVSKLNGRLLELVEYLCEE